MQTDRNDRLGQGKTTHCGDGDDGGGGKTDDGFGGGANPRRRRIGGGDDDVRPARTMVFVAFRGRVGEHVRLEHDDDEDRSDCRRRRRRQRHSTSVAAPVPTNPRCCCFCRPRFPSSSTAATARRPAAPPCPPRPLSGECQGDELRYTSHAKTHSVSFRLCYIRAIRSVCSSRRLE